MTVREHELKAHRFKIDEKRQKLKDLGELRQHIHATLDRMSDNESGVLGTADARPAISGRRETLSRSLEEIERQVKQTEVELEASQQSFDEQENAREGYDRVPVAVGSRRGRGQVEHIRIVRAQRD
jgi:chromosome segregation ATPase